MLPKTTAALLSCFALLGVAGCGGGPETAPVTGIVTLDGDPLPGAAITFSPESTEGSTSHGMTDAQGKYSLMFTRDKSGAMIGKHNVLIEIGDAGGGSSESCDPCPPPDAGPRPKLPQKYRQPGALTAEVVSGKNEIDFPLTSQ